MGTLAQQYKREEGRDTRGLASNNDHTGGVEGLSGHCGRVPQTRHEPQRARVNDLWSRTLRWDAQTMRPKEGPIHQTVKDVTLPEAMESTKDREKRSGTS